ncbi:MAG TPA: IS256 family transposase [Thermoanaerobaculia bacterium]
MTDQRMALLARLEQAAGSSEPDVVREALRWAIEELMEADVTERLGAEPHERTPDRLGQRNGHRLRLFDSRVGALELAIPRTRTGSYYPDWLLQPRRRAERALVAVIQEAYVKGVSTRKVDDLVRAMGASGVSKSEVSRLVGELDVDLAAFRERRLEGTQYPYLWLDAQYEKVRDGGRIVNAAFLVAIAANERGEREVLGCTVAAAESEASWTAFLRSLVGRGLTGVRLVTSDAHLGIRAAVGATLDGAAWQRCRVHLLRDLLTHVPRHASAMVAAFVRTIFAQPDEAAARAQLRQVAERLATSFPKAAEILLAAEDDVLAYLACPREHWTKIWSTNPLERLNRELARRNDVVGIFPNREALLRLGTALLAEQHDEWLTMGKRYLTQASLTRLIGGVPATTLGDLLKEGVAV